MKRLPFLRLTAATTLLVLIGGCQSNLQLRQQAELDLKHNQPAAALEKYQQAVNHDPTDYRAQYGRGVAELALNDPLTAQLALEKALSLTRDNDPLRPTIMDRLAESMYRQHHVNDLNRFLADAVKAAPTTTNYLRQAEYLTKTGDVDAAETAYRKAAYFAAANDVRPYLAIARFYQKLHDAPQAIQALRYANYVAPDNREAADALREYGIVPGPAAAQAPPKPALLRGKS